MHLGNGALTPECVALTYGAAAAGLWKRTRAAAVVAGAGALVGLVWLNWGFYAFLARKRGWGFALAALPWHILYFLLSGAAFGLGLAMVRLNK